MAIIYQTDRKTGTVYVLEQTSTWIPELKQPRTKRHIIGKLDPETNEIIPTGPVGRPKKAPVQPPEPPGPVTLEERVQFLEERLARLEAYCQKLEDRLQSASRAIAGDAAPSAGS